jgi:hypothetical protein
MGDEILKSWSAMRGVREIAFYYPLGHYAIFRIGPEI